MSTTRHRTTTTTTTTTRKASLVVAFVLVLLQQQQTAVVAFLQNPPLYNGPSLSISPWIPTTTATAMSPSTTDNNNNNVMSMSRNSYYQHQTPKDDSMIPAYVRQPPLSVEETTILLKQAKEWKRLKELERTLALRQSPSLKLPSLSVRAKEAGYYDDDDNPNNQEDKHANPEEAYEHAMKQGAMARETLVTRNMGLVYFCVESIVGKRRQSSSATSSRRCLSREDLIQEGALGLSRAIDKYKSNMGTKFSSYAVYWIRAAILRALAEQDDYMMRIPEHVTFSISKIQRAAKRLGMKGTTPLTSWQEAHAAKLLAEEAGLTHLQVENALKVQKRRQRGSYVSLEGSTEYEQSKVLAKLVSDDEEQQQQQLLSDIDVDKMKQVLSQYLRPKEMEAISWRYGLLSTTTTTTNASSTQQQQQRIIPRPRKGMKGEAMSFQEVGKQMQVSKEYCRRLCHQALEKLRRAAEEGHLYPAQLYYA